MANNNKNTKSLAQYLNAISRHVYEHGFDNLDDKSSKDCSHCASVLKLKKRQIELLAVVIELALRRKPVTLGKVMHDMDGKSDTLKVLSLKDDLDELALKRLLYYNPGECILDAFIYVPERVISDIANSRKPEEYTYKAATMREFGETIGEFLNHYRPRTFDPELFDHMMNVLFKDNPDNPVVKGYQKYNMHLKPFEMVIWGYMLQQNIIYAKREFLMFDVCNDLNFSYPMLSKAIINGRQTFELEEKGLMEFTDKPQFIRFTEVAIQEFLADLQQKDADDDIGIDALPTDDDCDMFCGSDGESDENKKIVFTLIKSDAIPQKQLFYNKEETAVLEELKTLFSPDKYPEVVERMTQSGVRTGFNCLLFGGPGTGKTEFVYQLARSCGRDIIKADFSCLRNKWAGESEKAIRALFRGYREKVESSETAPILLLNECDGLLSKRVDVVDSADFHVNSCQTILLEEMEELKGIAIYTSNNPCNLDSAFERRFLYRLEIHKPDENSRRGIWHSLCPDLSDSEINELAGYDLSGGQIENVSRQRSIWTVLHGIGQPFADVKARCETELKSYMNKTAVKNKIGFC